MTTDVDLSDSDFDKVVGQYRLKLNGLLAPLRLYGQGYYVDSLAEELVSLSIQMHLRLSGIDMPYTTTLINDD